MPLGYDWGARKVQGQVTASIPGVQGAFNGEEAAEEELQMSSTTVCGNKVKWSLYGSADCTGDLLEAPEDSDDSFTNEATFEWDACTLVPGETAIYLKVVAGDSQDTTTDVDAAAGAMALKGAMAVALIAATLY